MAGTLVIGFVFVDIKGFSNGPYVPAGRNLGSVHFIHGGVSRNVAEDMANTGMPVTFASLCDESALGRDVMLHLNEVGVDTSAVEMVKEGGMGTWMVILDETGDVAGQISCPPDVSQLEQLMARRGEELVRQADNIVLELDISPAIDELVLDWARKYDKPVYTVVGNMSVILSRPEFVSALDCFVCNEVEIGRIFDSELAHIAPEDMLAFLRRTGRRLGCRSAVVTMGAQGSVYLDFNTGEGGICHSIPTKLVDSSGAGDSFLAGTVMGLSRGLPLARAVEAGTMMASRTIQTTESCMPRNEQFWENF